MIPEPPAATPAVPDDVVNVLSDAHRRAPSSALPPRICCEKRWLSSSVWREMEQARRAGDHQPAQQLAISIEAAEQSAAWAKKLDAFEAEKREAEALKNDDRRAVETATAEIAAAESRLAAARALRARRCQLNVNGTLGVCRNANCPAATSGTTLEIYPVPGQYCPERGEALEPVPERSTTLRFAMRSPSSTS